jgi:hypothetical protein
VGLSLLYGNRRHLVEEFNLGQVFGALCDELHKKLLQLKYTSRGNLTFQRVHFYWPPKTALRRHWLVTLSLKGNDSGTGALLHTAAAMPRVVVKMD